MSGRVNNVRIAKNTIALYVRMFIVLCISIYTSRVVLATLGIEDYGIYNVVGGMIAIFSSLGAAAQRYLTFGLGKGDPEEVNRLFCASLQCHAIFALALVILAETIGLWLLLEKLVIPDGRQAAAMWVFQCSVAGAAISLLTAPYEADIIANEKMSVFAWISIVEASLKLAIVYLLTLSSYDRLVTYGVLMLVFQVGIKAVYVIYSSTHFPEARYHHGLQLSLMKDMFGFTGWNFYGTVSNMLYTQGLNVMLNMFFGTVVNAARGIAVQIQNIVQQFASNFQMAINPQIIKSYAAGEMNEMHSLMFRSSRFSYYLMFLLVLPIFLETDCILGIWLCEVPEHSSAFMRLMLLIALLNPISSPCSAANQANGNIKSFELLVGTAMLMILPVSYFFLKAGAPAWSVFAIHLCIGAITQAFVLLLIRKQTGISLRKYCIDVIWRIVAVTLASSALPTLLHFAMGEGIARLATVVVTGLTGSVAAIYAIGIHRNEREFLKTKLKEAFDNDRK